MGLSRGMTVAENLALRRYRASPMGRLLHLDHTRMNGFARELIERYEIPATPRWTVTRLSGGGLQRVVVARELARETPLIVAAQPTRGLDVRSTEFVRQQLVASAERGAGVLVISEDLDELMALADRIVVLYEGSVAAVVARERFERHELGALMVGGEKEPADVEAAP
jgi:simple sugar transport system ATP-binding protein